MSERGSPYSPDRTVNTATDRQLGLERGMVVAYLDIALDALSHLKERTSAGRAWLISDDNLEEILGWLTGSRQEVLRKERVDTRPPAQERQTRGVDDLDAWVRQQRGRLT